MTIQPDIQVTKVFEKNWISSQRIIINRGGTRSSKTYSLCQILMVWLLTGFIGQDQFIPKGYASVVRKTLPALKATAERTLLEILKEGGYYLLVNHHKTDRIISFGERHIEFFSIDDQNKVRGRKRQILFINEASELGFKDEYYQLAIRTEEKIFLDFNPDDSEIWINTELEQKRAALEKDVEVIVSNYKWNGYLPERIIKEIEYSKHIDPELWEVFGRGNYGKLTGTIFPKYELIDAFPDESELSRIDYGLDFGYVHPQAFVKVGYREGTSGRAGELYLEQLYYESYKTNGEFIDFLKDSGFIYENKEIIADPAQPGDIKEIRDAGFRVQEATKDKGSVFTGIRLMQRMKIFIVASSQDLVREFRKYKWKDRKDNDPKELAPVKLYDDGIDAARYVVYTRLHKEERIPGHRRRPGVNPTDPAYNKARQSVRAWNKRTR